MTLEVMAGTQLETDSPDAVAWQREQDVAAEQELRSLSAFEPFREILVRGVLTPTAYPLKPAAGLWFEQTRLQPTDEQPVIVVRTHPTGEPRVLLDPRALGEAEGRQLSLAACEPSPDGRLLAYIVMEAGAERGEVAILDVATGVRTDDEIPWSVAWGMAWLADSSGLYLSAQDISTGQLQTHIYLYRLGEPLPTEPEPLPADLLFPFPLVSEDGRYAAIRTGNSSPRTTWIHDGSWRPFLDDVSGAHHGSFFADDFYALVDDGHPRGRVVKIPIATATDTSTWTELVPESADVMRWVRVVGGRLVIGFLRNATSWLRVLDLEGNLLDELAVSGRGAIDVYASGATQLLFPMFFDGDGALSLLLSTPTSSPSVWTYDVSSGVLTEVRPSEVSLSGLVVRQITTTSTDGVTVPATVVHRADLDLGVPHPTLIHAYGGYGVGYLPAYRSVYTSFAEAGGIFVLAHVRGGSEGGAEWWRNGRRDRKQQTFDDVIAVAEEMVRQGLTTPAQLGLEGGSNGGTMAGAVLVQRPDLFAAVVSHVPQLDLIGMQRDPVGFGIASIEYGDPSIPEEAEWLRKISPRHGIVPGVAYPAVLIACGENDPRCPAWHSRVFVAELREASTGDAPILLRAHREQGHGPSDRGRTLDQMAEWLAFIAEHTGLRVSSAPPNATA